MKVLNWMRDSRLGRTLEHMLDGFSIEEPFRSLVTILYWIIVVMFHTLTLFAYVYTFVSLLF